MLEFDLDDLARRYTAGESLEALAKSVGLSGNGLRDRFRRAGITLADRKNTPGAFRRRVTIDTEELVRRYTAGETEQALAKSFGVARTAIRRRLLEAGVPIRNRAEANAARMAKASSQERSQLAEAAHAAVRGVPQSEEHRRQIAIANERSGRIVSDLERQLFGWLRDRGLEIVPQKAVGRYNIDLALTEARIAVEVFGGNWHTTGRHATRFRPRIEYLLDRNWLPVIVWVTARYPLDIAVAEYIVTLHKACGRGKASRCQEHVVRGDGYVAPISEVKPDNGTIVKSS